MSDQQPARPAASAHTVGEQERRDAVRATRRFDLRRILGGLFVVYGVIVLIVGIVNNTSDVHRTGMPINLYTGGGMLVLGILFFVWDRLAPVPEQDIVASLQSEEDANSSAAEAEG